MQQDRIKLKYNFDEASKYYENGDYDKAIKYFQKAIVLKPKDNFDIEDNIDVYVMIGMSYMCSDDDSKECLENIVKYYNLALNNIKRVKKTLSKFIFLKTIYDDLGIVYQMLKDIPNAIKYYEKSINFDDKVSVTSYSNLIYVYKNVTKELEKALNLALKFVELDSENERAYLDLALVYVDLENFEKVIKTLEISIEKIENPYMSYCNLSDVYLRKKEFEKAKEFAQKALDIEPNDYIAISNLAEAYEGLGDRILAKEQFMKALEIEPEFEPAISGLIRV